ncbi:hypothetical protein BJ741DRAFT_169287 [Chytriomyces cf. hyalinus JEL632]|nr:hypothetical protein BJ741DRAFT_169287 [Chytriomyces cf. hyalinus JEL632]
MDAETSQAVQTANQLLTVLGVSLRIKHVRECVSSLFVALFEGFLHTRIGGIQRNAVSRFDKIANVQRVISAFEEQVLVGGSSSLAHISAAEIVDGNSRHICNLMLLFGDLESAIHKSVPPMPSHDRDWSSQSQASLNSQDENSTKLPAQHLKPVKKQSSISSAGATQAVESAHSNRANSQKSAAAPSTFSIPSNVSSNSAKPRIKRGMSGASSDPHLLRVVDDVERYVLLEARRKADSELHSRVEDSLGTVQRDVEKRKRIVSDSSAHSSDMPPAKTNTRIQFNLKASSSSPISSLLQVQPSDTPHTRALKIRQQRLIAAKNEASARVESVSAFARRSMKTISDSQKSINKATVSTKTRRDGASTSHIFKKIGQHGRMRGSDLWIDDRMNDDEDEVESENNAPVSESYLDASEYDSDLADIESFLNKSVDEEHISNESFPSEFEPGQTVSEEEESFGYDRGDTFHESFDSERLFDDHGQTEMSIKEGSSFSGNAAVLASRNDEGPSIAERNFEEFEGIIKSQLGIKTIPKATKNVVWSGQLRDRRKQLDSRLHARKRNMHKEISTFSDVRPIQVLRRETEKAAFMKQSKREREAQRQAKIAVSEQKRRVVRMENRVSEVEGQIQSVTQKRQMREAQFAQSLYDSYLSSQREIVREALRKRSPCS